MSYIIKTRDDFWLDDISALTYGLAVDMPQPVPMARQRITKYQSGDTDTSTPDDSFEDVRYTLTARRIKSPDNFIASDLYAALATARTLRLTRNADRYYKIASVVDVVPTASLRGNEQVYKITLLLSPFAYHTTNPEIAPENNVITNPGTRFSRPVYKITNTSAGGQVYYTNGSITVNGQELQIDFGGASQKTVVVDAEKMIAYDDSTHENLTRFTAGLFPFLSPGDNAIVTDQCTVTVVGNWRDY